MFTYTRKVQYYETDKMGVTHNSNYLRWMEEARCAFLDCIGWSYKKFEDMGITSPVVFVSCEYKSPTTYDDEFQVNFEIEKITSSRLMAYYEIVNKTSGKLAAIGRTTTCMLSPEGDIIRIDRALPDYYAALSEHLKK